MAIDQKTGEVYDDYDPFLESDEEYKERLHQEQNLAKLEEEQVEEINLPAIWQGGLPEHIRQLYALALPEEEKLGLLSIYESGTKVPFKRRINTDVTITGAIIWYHPPFKGKDLQEHDGYYKIMFLTDEWSEDMPVVLEASMGALTMHTLAMLRLNGWYLWEKPVTYRLRQDEKTNAFQMINLDRVNAMREAARNRVKGKK